MSRYSVCKKDLFGKKKKNCNPVMQTWQVMCKFLRPRRKLFFIQEGEKGEGAGALAEHVGGGRRDLVLEEIRESLFPCHSL